MTQNVHAQHNDTRVEELRQKYGKSADMKVDELQDRARKAGISNPSGKNKEELLMALSRQGGGSKRR
jgi:hypothetical protein